MAGIIKKILTNTKARENVLYITNKRVLHTRLIPVGAGYERREGNDVKNRKKWEKITGSQTQSGKER